MGDGRDWSLFLFRYQTDLFNIERSKMMTLALGVCNFRTRGSNLMAILDAIQQGTLDATVKVVVSNKAKAVGLELAKAERHSDGLPRSKALCARK